LYQSYAKAMYATAVRILKVGSDAEDILQEAFLEAFNKINDLKENGSFGAWLKSIVINKSLAKLKKNKLEFEDIENQNNTAYEEDDYDFEETQRTIEDIKKALLELSDGFRTILTLHLFEGYDYDEVAQMLGISAVTCRTQYIRGKAKLLEILKRKNIQYSK
jgi:RNA polymerase sigma factor (sigma-70 family)